MACRSDPVVLPAATDTAVSASQLPTSTIRPTETATPLPPPTVTSSPTLPATATATIQPSATATPQPTLTPITPTATQPIPGLIGPDNFPANVNPLTGETVRDPAILQRRPIAVKVSNYPSLVRPQSGLNNADLLFEHYAESGATRFTAVYYSRDADPIGSIRSGRLIDLEIPAMYDAAFAYSGASGPIRLMFRDSDFFSRIISPDFGHGGFFRVPDPAKAFEHTLFTDTYTIRAILDGRGQNNPPVWQSNMAFRVEAVAGGQPAGALEIRYLGANAFWHYNLATSRYTRWTDGQPHLDANTGTQLNFKNIVVLGAHHEETTIIEDRGGNLSIQIQLWGEGPVSLFRDGQRFEGRWRRANPAHMMTFYDLEGNILPLAPGNTVFQIVPLGFTGLVVTG